MTGAVAVAVQTAYRARAERAAHLAGERPHAGEILALYRQVLALQEPLFGRAPELGAPQQGRPSIGRLPFARLDGLFVGFVADLAADANDELSEVGSAILRAPAGLRTDLLRLTAVQGDLVPLGRGLSVPVPELAFFSRAFLQPFAEVLMGAAEPALSGEGPDAVCPRCGWPPQVAVLRDDGETQGRRTLVCGLCATEWPYPRVRCPSCGEVEAGKLALHEAEGVPALRLAECESCQAYLKEVDLRLDGHAVPVVDDLATPELDVWAGERGLWKICRNLMGL